MLSNYSKNVDQENVRVLIFSRSSAVREVSCARSVIFLTAAWLVDYVENKMDKMKKDFPTLLLNIFSPIPLQPASLTNIIISVTTMTTIPRGICSQFPKVN